jgi:hypothetical protein
MRRSSTEKTPHFNRNRPYSTETTLAGHARGLSHRTSTEIDRTSTETTLAGHARGPAAPHFNRNRPHFNRNVSALQPKLARTSTEQFPHFNRKATALQPKFSSGFANGIKGLRSNEVGQPRYSTFLDVRTLF